LVQIARYFPQIMHDCSLRINMLFPGIGEHINHRKYSSRNALSEHSSILLVRVLVVDALSSLTGIGSVANCARLPVLIFVELALEVQGMVDVGEAKLDVVALIMVLVALTCRLGCVDSLLVHSCLA
jgi:hypothetical protein